MIRELLAHNDYVRVLNALERRPMRFGRLQDELELHPPQVNRALKFLCETKLVASEFADTATGLPLIGGGLASAPVLSSICGSGGPKDSAKR